MRTAFHLGPVTVFIVLAGLVVLLLQGRPVSAEDSTESLRSTQQKIVAAAAKAKPSVVRVVWNHDGWDDAASGVILTRDGYIATYLYRSHHVPMISDRYRAAVPTGQAVSVDFADGRRVPAVVVGSYQSHKDLSFDLVKITKEGNWPFAEISQMAREPGKLCIALGFLRGPHKTRCQESSVRIGHLIPRGAPGVLRTSCVFDGLDDRGGGLFDLDGCLLGIHLFQTYGDWETFADPIACHLDSRVVRLNRKGLAEGKSDSQGPVPDQAEADASRDAALPPPPSPDSSELAATAAKAREATVALATRHAPLGCSGTIVTADGYIATCGHHQLARGTKTTVTFADGSTASGTFLGRDDTLDIGLARITDPGPWPYVEMGKTSDVKVGDPCIIAGYPNYLRKDGKVPLVVRGARIADMRYAPAETLSSCKVWDGDSGGGLFDHQGRLIGVLSGRAKPRKVYAHSGVDGIGTLWDLLVDGPAPGDPVPFEASATAKAMVKAIEGASAITCEVLSAGKRRALGTIVSRNGYVLTKASELYGKISCRLSDGRELPATLGGLAPEHDLAILKIDADDLPHAEWNLKEDLPVGTLVAALRGNEPPKVGIVSHAVHEVAPATGYLPFGSIKDGEGGVILEEVHAWNSVVEDLQTGQVMPEDGAPLRAGDVLLSIEGRRVPSVHALEQIAQRRRTSRTVWDIPFAIAGDPICITFRRAEEERTIRTPLPSPISYETVINRRSASFPAVFDTDASLTSATCGGPIVDCNGRVVGIAIAVPGTVIGDSPVPTRVYVIPGAIARAVAERLK